MILVQLDIEEPQVFYREVHPTFEDAAKAVDKLLDQVFPYDDNHCRTGPCKNLTAVYRDIETDEEIRRIGPCSF